MKITARKDVPCVSQTKEWKGFFEAHFMSGEEIDKKYPILNPLWTLVKVERFDGVKAILQFDQINRHDERRFAFFI